MTSSPEIATKSRPIGRSGIIEESIITPINVKNPIKINNP